MIARSTIALAASLAVCAAAQAAAQPQRSPDARDTRDRGKTLRELRTAYQGRRGPEQTESFSRRVRLGRDGRVSLANLAGQIVVTAGSGDEVSIEAVKRTRGSREDLAAVNIEVDERPGRVDIRTTYEDRSSFRGRNNGVAVDFTVSVPAGASLDLNSISGNVKVTGIRGAVRAETVSGNVTTSSAPRVEVAKSVSGDVEVSDVSSTGDLILATVSGSVHGSALKAHSLDLNTVNGQMVLQDVTCDRLEARSVAGDVEYSGPLAKDGRYELSSHSGSVRFGVSGNTGFTLEVTTFSGSIQNQLPAPASGDRQPSQNRFGRGGAMRATYGDGSATVAIRSFSGQIVLTKR